MQRPVRDMWPVPGRKANDFNFPHKDKWPSTNKYKYWNFLIITMMTLVGSI